MKKLFPYQEEGVLRLIGMGGSGLLADEPGLGKTAQAIRVCDHFEDVRRVLVVCPASLKINWQREWKMWSQKSRAVGVAFSDKVPSADVVIVNYDIVDRNGQTLTELVWDMTICDEAHMLRNPGAKRTQRVLGLGCQGVRTKRKLLLTGTPLLARPIELYPLLWWLDPKGWGTYEQFGERYCGDTERVIVIRKGHRDNYKVVTAVQYPKTYWDLVIKPKLVKPFPQIRVIGKYQGAKNLGELSRRIAPFMVRRTKEEVLPQLPEKIRQVIEIDPDDAALAILCREHDLWRRLRQYAAKEGKSSDWKDVVRNPKNQDIISVTRQELVKTKVPLVLEFVERALDSGEKLVVFGYHIEPLKLLKEKLGDKAVMFTGQTAQSKRQEFVDRFQSDPTCSVFIGQYVAAGVGLTLTASRHVLFIEPDWTPAIMEQAEDRVHRISQTRGVLCQYLVYADSIEAEVVRAAVKKQDTIDATLGYTEEVNRWFC